MRETEPELIAQTRVVHQSEPLGFPPIACAAAAENDARTVSLRKALLRIANDELGRSVLEMLRLDGFSIEPPSLFDPIAAEISVLKRAAG
jgi:phosphonate transport system substrate-binding protein